MNIIDVCEHMDFFTKNVCLKFFEKNEHFIILKCTAYLVALYRCLLEELIEIVKEE